MEIKTTKIFEEIENAMNEGYTSISLQGSSRSGKTRNSVIFLVYYCLSNPCTSVSVIRATLPALKRSVLRDFQEVFYQFEADGEFNKSELIYTFSNGSFIEFFSSDNEQKLRGGKRNILYVNEANELSFIEFQQLQMRTTKFTIIDYNPSFSEDHWINTFNEERKTKHFITTYKDNPFLEQKVIDEIESLQWRNPTMWQVYGLGQRAIIEGLVFKHFDIVEEVPEFISKRWIGIDFGYTNDETAIVEVSLFENDFYIREICYQTQMSSSDIIRELKQFREYKIISESADPRLVNEIFRAGINIHPVRKYPGSIEAGISKMQEFNIKITRYSENAIKEFKNYTYQRDKEGKWLNTPVDSLNHIIDACRYVVLTEILDKANRKPIDLQRLAKMIY